MSLLSVTINQDKESLLNMNTNEDKKSLLLNTPKKVGNYRLGDKWASMVLLY